MTKVAIVTGATRGVGKGVALGLARWGFDVVVTGRTLHEGEGRVTAAGDSRAIPGSIERTVQEIKDAGGRAFGLKLDIMDRDSIDGAIDRVLKEYGRIDVLVNNGLYAGPAINQPFDQITMEGAEDAFRGCVVNQIHITRKCMPAMIKQGEGRVFFMSSAASVNRGIRRPVDGGWAMLYGAAKSALNRVGEFLHLEHERDGILSFLVHPNFTVTETMKTLYGDDLSVMTDGLTVHQPEETAEAIGWLATHPDAKKYAGPKLHSAPDFFKKHGIDPKA